tara:strand:- start:305 stop:907 length:603 start_codon:yes stop_codon:yes gene_type:complete
MEILTPFSYLFGSQVLKEDFSELDKSTDYQYGNSQAEIIQNVDNYRILEKYPKYKIILTAQFKYFIKKTMNYPTVDWQISTSWITCLNKGDRVHFHNHKNCLWSCVLYFGEYGDDAAHLAFRNPISEREHFLLGKDKGTPMTQDIAIKPEHNLLVIFPSSINHYSMVNNEDGRKSLAFNMVPVGKYGSGDSSYNPSWFHQ